MSKLEQALKDCAVPYPNGRLVGAVSMDELSTRTDTHPKHLLDELRALEDSGWLESVLIGGRVGTTVFYLVAA